MLKGARRFVLQRKKVRFEQERPRISKLAGEIDKHDMLIMLMRASS